MVQHKTIPYGTKINQLTVLDEAGYNHKHQLLYNCLCDCGNYKIVHATKLRARRQISCGCKFREKHYQLIGFKFASFEVVENCGINSHRNALWKCVCSKCGYEWIKTSKSIVRIKESVKSNFHCPGCGVSSHKENLALNYFIRTYIIGARDRNLDFLLTREEFQTLIDQDCFYCGAKPVLRKVGDRLKHDIYANGIDRVDNKVGYTLDNCVPCCKICNKAKLDFSQEEFISMCQRVVDRHGTLEKSDCCRESFG